MRAFVRGVARGAPRVLAGWALVAGGALALTGAVTAGVVGSHRTEDGFTVNLTPVHTEGHMILVPDVGAVLERHGLARLLGDGRLTIVVQSASTDVVAALVPSPDACTSELKYGADELPTIEPYSWFSKMIVTTCEKTGSADVVPYTIVSRGRTAGSAASTE